LFLASLLLLLEYYISECKGNIVDVFFIEIGIIEILGYDREEYVRKNLPRYLDDFAKHGRSQSSPTVPGKRAYWGEYVFWDPGEGVVYNIGNGGFTFPLWQGNEFKR
jgi:hypothetical protein